MDIIDKLGKEQKLEKKGNKLNPYVLDEIVKCYETSLNKINIYLDESYNQCFNSVKKIGSDYGMDEVMGFSITLANSQNHIHFSAGTGLFLSALINNCKENDFVIYTNHLQWQVDFMFFQNTKNIIVNGPLGKHAGMHMIDGCVSINGDAGIFLGNYMAKGRMILNGNTKFGVGYLMRKDAVLEINGDYDTISTSCAGKIYHNKVLIFEDNHPINNCFEYAILEDSPFMYKKK